MRLSVLLFVAAVPVALRAQPVVNAADHLPAVGTSGFLHDMPLTQPAPAGGANVTWDYAWLQPLNTSTVDHVTPDPVLLPDATVAVLVGGGDTRNLALGPDGLEEHGIATTAGTFVWNDRLLLLPTTITFNDNVLDDYAGSADIGFGTVTESGEVDILADGWGTLIMPDQTYANVLRLRSDRNFTTSFLGIGTDFFLQTYDYYAAGVVGPVLSDAQLFLNSGGQLISQFHNANFVLDQNVGQAEVERPALHAYPNPAAEQVWVRPASVTGPETLSVELLDAAGRVLRTERATPGVTLRIDLSGVAPGGYLLRAGAATQRLVVR